MNIKKSIFIPLLIFILIISVTIFLFLYIGNSFNKLPNCLRLRAGTVGIEVNYSDEFISLSYHNRIRLYRNRKGDLELRKQGKANAILDIDVGYYQHLKDIIGTSLVEPGPKYEKSVFNGYEAAFDQYEYEDVGIWKLYCIPFGNRVIEVSYHPSSLSEDELLLAEEMLHSLTFTQDEEDIKEAFIEKCEN